MAKKKSTKPSDELIQTLPVGEGQANAIMRAATLHKELIDELDSMLPTTGNLRERVMHAQQESFLFTRLCIENNPKSFPDPKPEMVFEEPEEPVFGDDNDDPDPGDESAGDDE